jgi:hypothetical protein
MDTSIFLDKIPIPDASMLTVALGKSFPFWNSLHDIVFQKYPGAIEEWNYTGAKYGWSYRIKDKKRAILYLLPRKDYFKVAFVFGQKATDQILDSNVSDFIKNELKEARVYAEGRGIRIDIKDASMIKDIEFLIEVKLAS